MKKMVYNTEFILPLQLQNAIGAIVNQIELQSKSN